MKQKLKWGQKFFRILLITIYICVQSLSFAQKDVYLVIGQSNTSGRGAIEAQDMVSLPGVDLFNGITWETATNIDPTSNSGDGGMNRYSPIRKTNKIQGLSFAYTFGKMTYKLTGTQIGLVVQARGGTSINDWGENATAGYYAQALTRLDAALALGGSTLKGILWHQGESDKNDANYIHKLKELISAFRTDLSMPNLPFFVGELSKHRLDYENFNTNLRQTTVVGGPLHIANTTYVSTVGLQTTDRIHFNSNAQRILGNRYAAKVLEKVYGLTYVQNQVIYVTQDAYVRGGSYASTPQQAGEPEFMRIKEDSSNANNIYRGLLEFDMSSISSIPNVKIVDASLLMSGNVEVTNGPIDIGFYDIDPTWSESTVNFNTAPNFTNQISESTTTFNTDDNDEDNDGDTVEVVHTAADITAFIRDKYAAASSIISLGLKSESDGNTQFKFSTKEDNANYADRAQIVISYFVSNICLPISGTDVQIACETFDWIDGNTYSASNNTATFTLTNATGCDSVVTLDLTINTPTTGTDVQVACETFDWIDGNTYSASNNTATFTLTNAAGCDSVVTLDLTINTVNVMTTVDELTITADQAGATYQWIDCATNMEIPGETNQSFTATSNGDYAVVVTENNCSDTSACTSITTVGLENNMAQIAIKAYPNPSRNTFTIESDMLLSAVGIYVVSVDGKEIFKTNDIQSSSYIINCSQWTPGVYFLTVATENGNKMLKLVKE
ncbi:sialate O-acetylesterase [Brumimicrobium aurantiacum]|nr:sialate O-acetylesterase [Brumimicrobium aurantiacum]